MRAIHLTVRGQVQGVGFRWFVREAARRAGLAGWVRNLPDGSVELKAAGSEQGVAYLVNVVRRGPERARVEDVLEVPLEDTEGLAKPFAVLKGG
jgi:acylphosphatase